MAHEIAPVVLSSNIRWDSLIVNHKRYNEVIIPLENLNDVYIANQSATTDDYILFDNLMVKGVTEDGRELVCYGSIRTKWLPEEGYQIITRVYNSHGQWNYAELAV